MRSTLCQSRFVDKPLVATSETICRRGTLLCHLQYLQCFILTKTPENHQVVPCQRGYKHSDTYQKMQAVWLGYAACNKFPHGSFVREKGSEGALMQGQKSLRRDSVTCPVGHWMPIAKLEGRF